MRRLAHITYLLAVVVLTAACSTHKNTSKSRLWHSFTARYNTYYNGSQAFIEGTAEKEKGNHDNYTEPLPLYVVGNKQSRAIGASQFDRTIEKMEKTIKQHSIKTRPEWNKSRRKTARDREWLSRREYNPFLWQAWLLMGKAQFQKGSFDEAAATFSYMSRLYQTQPLQYSLARAWLAKCYTEQEWLYDAEDVIRNMSRDSIHYRAQHDWDATYADFYLRSGEQEKALPYLRRVISHEHHKTQKARLYFLLGQTEAALGHNEQAYQAFKKVTAQNPPYELEFNARIAQTEVMAKGNSRQMISRLRRMARNDNNKDYLDQVYYAMGNIYLLVQKDTAKAIGAYEQGREKATRSGIEKGVLLLRLGGLYWQREKYGDAQQCYGEAIGLLDKESPDYEELSRRSKVLDELVPYTDAVYLQDSLQQLAKMSEKERNAAIDRVIAALKKKEKEERDRAREAEVAQAQQRQGAVGNRTMPAAQRPTATTQQSGAWYFYNQMAVNQGRQQFQQQWGKRENVDNWQRQNQTVVNLTQEESPDIPENPENPENPESPENPASPDTPADTLANDPHNREYYLAQIPFTEEQTAESNAIIADGLFHSGVIFKDQLDNLHLAEKQLLRLTTQHTDFAQMDEVWYHLFLLYSRRGRDDLAANCLSHLQAEHAESEWTILLSDPHFAENARFGQHIEDSLYAATYRAFQHDQFHEVAANARLSAQRFPLGQNRPRFLFIDGLSRLNAGNADSCMTQLRQVVEKYPQSEVSEMAGMIIKGVQEGRRLYGGKFDLGDLWTRRDIVLTTAADSTRTDTLSAERDTPFVVMLVYHPDSIAENQLLFELARYNFTNFLVRNFDLQVDASNAERHLMLVSGFLSYDEALQYARQLRTADASTPLSDMLRRCGRLLISEQNLPLLFSRFTLDEYLQFYEKALLPLTVSDEQLLLQPEGVSQAEDDDEEEAPDDEEPANGQGGGTFDFDDDFF